MSEKWVVVRLRAELASAVTKSSGFVRLGYKDLDDFVDAAAVELLLRCRQAFPEQPKGGRMEGVP